jgi:hypothetical protein
MKFGSHVGGGPAGLSAALILKWCHLRSAPLGGLDLAPAALSIDTRAHIDNTFSDRKSRRRGRTTKIFHAITLEDLKVETTHVEQRTVRADGCTGPPAQKRQPLKAGQQE